MKINAVQKVLLYTLVLNLIVAFGKIGFGFKASLISMMSDGFHSLMDSSSNIIALVALYFSNKQPDDKFQYGYKKFESFASLSISFLLFLTSYEIVKSLMDRFNNATVPDVSIESFIVMIITILINIWVANYEKKKGIELNNQLLTVDASHTSSDILVSFSVLISVFAVKMGFPIFDFLASSVIVVIIASLAWKILSESIGVLSDSSSLDVRDVERVVLGIDGVISCHKVRTRGLNDNIHIDLHIQVNPNITIIEAHKIGHIVQNKLKETFKGVYDVITHVEPEEEHDDD